MTTYNKEKGIAKVYGKMGFLKKIIKVKFCYSGVVFENKKGRKLVNYECLGITNEQ